MIENYGKDPNWNQIPRTVWGGVVPFWQGESGYWQGEKRVQLGCRLRRAEGSNFPRRAREFRTLLGFPRSSSLRHMPLTLRQIYSASSYGHPELYDCSPDGGGALHPALSAVPSNPGQTQTQASTAKTVLQDCGTSATLGALHQIAYLSSYALEIFDGLVSLADETKERVSSCSARVGALSSLLSRESAFTVTVANASTALQREVFVPTVLSKGTNSPSVTQTWDGCAAPPQFWRMDKVLSSLGLEPASSNSVYFSNPGFFFQEWVRVEQERQSMIRADRKKEKAARKERKLERRKLRERGDKHWADLTKLGESRRRRASELDIDGRASTSVRSSVHSSIGTPSERSGRSDRSSPSSRSSELPNSASPSGSASSSGSATGTDYDASPSVSSSDSGDMSVIQEEPDDDQDEDDAPSDSDASGSQDSNDSRSPPPSSSAPPSEPATPSGSERSGRSGLETPEPPTPSDEPTPSETASVRSPASPASPAPPFPTPPPPGPSPPKQGAMASIRGIFGSQAAAVPRPSTRPGARPSVLARKSTFHGARNAFVPKLVTETRPSVRPLGLAAAAAAAVAPPVWGLGSIFKTTTLSSSATAAASAVASAERKGGDSDSDDEDKLKVRRVLLARSRSKTGSVNSSSMSRTSQHEPVRRTDSHSTINTEHSAYAKPALPPSSDSRAATATGGGFMSSLTSIFRGGKSASATAGTTAAHPSPAALSTLQEGDDEDRPDSSARPRGSSRSSLRRASVDSSPPPPSDDDEPPDSDEDLRSEAPSIDAKKSPPPPPLSPPPLKSSAAAAARSSAARRKSSFFNSQAEPDEPSDDDNDGEGGDKEPAEESKQKEPESDGSEDSDPPVSRRPLNTWMKASSAYRPVERVRGDSDMHRKRSTSHMRGSAHAGGRKRSSTADEDGRHSLVGASAARVSLTPQERASLTVRRSVFGENGEAQQQHSKLHHNQPSAPPPPPPPPARRRLDSAIRDALKLAPTLRKAEAAPAKKVDLRTALMGAIKQGAVALKAVEVKPIEAKVVRVATSPSPLPLVSLVSPFSFSPPSTPPPSAATRRHRRHPGQPRQNCRLRLGLRRRRLRLGHEPVGWPAI